MSGAKLVPELLVSDHAASRDFYVGTLGFAVRYERLAEKFSYLDLGGAELMITPSLRFDTRTWTTSAGFTPLASSITSTHVWFIACPP